MMQDWEKTLALLVEQGWHYAYIKCIDLEEGTDNFYVSIRRGNQNLTSLRPSLAEAVRVLGHLASEAAAS